MNWRVVHKERCGQARKIEKQTRSLNRELENIGTTVLYDIIGEEVSRIIHMSYRRGPRDSSILMFYKSNRSRYNPEYTIVLSGERSPEYFDTIDGEWKPLPEDTGNIAELILSRRTGYYHPDLLMAKEGINK